MTSADSDGSLAGSLENCLPDLLRSQRWFAGKTDAALTVQVEDIVPVSSDGYQLAIVTVGSESSAVSRTYVVSVCISDSVTECSAEAGFWQSLLRRLASEPQGISSQSGQTLRLTPGPGIAHLDSLDASTRVAVHPGEQSNTSAVIGDDVFLKLFRKVEPGINPDSEIATRLSEQAGYDASPQVVATIELTDGNTSRCIALLSELVHAEADAWTTTLAELSEYWQRVSAWDAGAEHREPPASGHMSESLCGSFVQQVAELGTATARMHVALSSVDDDAFRPEPFCQSQLAQLVAAVKQELADTCRLLSESASCSAHVSADIESAGQTELQRLAALQLSGDEVRIIRCHGDYHLGQVLWTGTQWKIIDFEGEPDRPLSERREKQCALKDVAGMVRSFHYASNAGSVGLIDAPANTIDDPDRFRDEWYRVVRDAFLTAWRAESDGSLFAPTDDGLYWQLLDLFLLEKVLYELRYELQNRPGWVPIPLAGIAHVLKVSVPGS